MVTITDNCTKKLSDFGFDNDTLLKVKCNLGMIANTKISNLSHKTPNLLVFPRDLHYYGDEISKSTILTINEEEISTGNIMGFVGVNDTQVNIKSRFSKSDEHDYFLHYMLQRVFSINLFDIKHSTNSQPIFDFIIYLFPYFLKKAFAQGIYKRYRRYDYNNTNIRGPIDVNRHIHQNVPFKGSVAYSTREHSYDNEITQLIRHTIEYLRLKEQGSIILNNDNDTRDCVSQIIMATPTYNFRDRNKIISQNLRPVRHPYFSNYTDLQKICLQILCHDSIKYGQEKDKVYGVLFDGAWLWEEYLYTILKTINFKHPENKNQKGGFRMFEKPEVDDIISNNSRSLYPDFYKDNFILDAKYKHLNYGVGREDLYQVVTYMYCKKYRHGGYIYPSKKSNQETESYRLAGYNGYMHLFPFCVPQFISNKSDGQEEYKYNDFVKEILKSEDLLKGKILKAEILS